MSNYQVLVVDDQPHEAQAFADLVASTTGLRCFAASDPRVAIETVELADILVAVLDERMPLMSGTRLFAELQRISPTLVAIMLTQEEKNAAAAGDAMRLGYKERVHKSRVTELPGIVLRYYVQAVAQRARQTEHEVLWRRNKSFGLPRRGNEVWLVSCTLLEKEFVDEERWRNLAEVHTGQKHKVTTSLEMGERYSLEEESKSSLESTLGIKAKFVAEVSSQVISRIEDRLATTIAIEIQSAHTVEDEFRLPDEPSDSSQCHVRVRHIEFAPVYSRYRVVLRNRCRDCNQDQYGFVVVREQRNLVALRQIDHMSDGTSRTLSAGFRRLA